MKKLSQFKYVIVSLAISALFFTCSSQDDNARGDWLIPADEVFDGGPGKDGIPSVDSPQFSDLSEVDFLEPTDLILGIKIGNEIRAYPHQILDWHEIINDDFADKSIAITYCPLTGTGIAWNRTIDGRTTTFGVSGLLYNTNLIPYDRETDSNWSQMLNQSVEGSRSGAMIETYSTVETTWASWQTMFPNSKVLNTNTGIDRSYGEYPYGSYRTNNNLLLFPVSPDDTRLPRKQRGLGVIINDVAKFYSLSEFSSGGELIQDSFQGTELVVFGSNTKNYVVAYDRQLPDGTLLEFTSQQNSLGEGLAQDQEGNVWNLFGEAISGPRLGTKLASPSNFMGYWFAFGAFYPATEIF